MSCIGEIDAQIRAEVAKRDDAIDRLITALIEVDTLTQRLDVLLDRRTEATT